MNDKFPLMDYRIWEINWLNEFWNHQIAQNKIFLEVENIGCEFVYTELCERHSGKILLRPDENELYRYGGQNTIIVDRLISEAPKGSPYPYNTPLEKIVVDFPYTIIHKWKLIIHFLNYFDETGYSPDCLRGGCLFPRNFT